MDGAGLEAASETAVAGTVVSTFNYYDWSLAMWAGAAAHVLLNSLGHKTANLSSNVPASHDLTRGQRQCDGGVGDVNRAPYSVQHCCAHAVGVLVWVEGSFRAGLTTGGGG